MAIVKMSRFSLFTFDADRDKLLHELQKFGYVHFTNLKAESAYQEEGLTGLEVPEALGEVDEEIQDVKFVLDLLKRHDDRETGIKGMIRGKSQFTFEELEKKVSAFDYPGLIGQFKKLTGEIDSLSQEEMKCSALVEELRPWKSLDFELKSLRNLQFSEVFTGTVPKKLLDKLKSDLGSLTETHVEFISESKDEGYLLAITTKGEKEALSEILRNSSYSQLQIPTELSPAAEIAHQKEKLQRIKAEKKALEGQIKAQAGELPQFEETYEYLLNKKLRFAAETNFMKTDHVNVLSGYVPTEHVDTFTKAVETTQAQAYYLEVKEAESDDDSVPILLKNGKFVESFESLTTMYALPKYSSVDPTPLFAPFYLAFFGMMVGDLGFGLVMLVGTVLALRFFNLDKGTKTFVRFFFYLSFSTIVWGLVFGSFFGGVIPMKGLINPSTQYQELLIVSIIFGGIHLFYALAIKAYLAIRDGKPWNALFDVGFWYMALMGAIVFLLTMFLPLAPVVKTIALVVMVTGMAGIVLTGGRDNESVVGKAAGGLYSLYGISSYIGDFVSYSRLMALGLSGGFISTAINMMVGMLFDMGFLGYILGVVVFLGGQAFNLFLSALSAYVHTSRLTYVEFFGKFYEGGGKGFKLFRNKTKYINLE
ncbi:V-type ATP synthase subunit I [Proteiniclasticum sp. BAD-10]|uniref:V-type ATP synthase subunit I n=1 Tax=Proteiniclasticum sediminis TaxID=2804028 RepID=A0A941CR48_9CLOT|nr:V-type ATP synthase subunit I [Proteiniclasticum sediminis]MBR0575823.1 V-type ATP synthase subunit I [Proteiniclasticum sediminis]